MATGTERDSKGETHVAKQKGEHEVAEGTEHTKVTNYQQNQEKKKDRRKIASSRKAVNCEEMKESKEIGKTVTPLETLTPVENKSRETKGIPPSTRM